MIGLFDESDVIDALLPACLKNGENPASFNTGSVPLYTGPQGVARTTTLVNCESGYGYKDNGTIEFDGVNDYLAMSSNVFSNLTPKFTIVLWVDISCYTGVMYSELYDVSTSFIRFYIYQGKLTVLIRQNNGTNALKVGTPIVGVHCIALTCDIVAGELKTYIDGVYQQTIAIASLATPTVNTAFYGLRSLELPEPFAKTLLGLVLYKKALVASEVASLCTLGPDLGGLKMYADGRLVAPNRRKQHGLNVGISLSL